MTMTLISPSDNQKRVLHYFHVCYGDLGKVGVMIIDNVDENSVLTFFVYEAPYI